MNETQDPNTWPDIADFDLERKQLARKRAIAEQLLASRLQGPSISPQGRFVLTPESSAGGQIAAGLDRIVGNIASSNLDQTEKLLGQAEVGQGRRLLAAQGLDPNLANAPQGIRDILQRQMLAREAQIEKGEQAAADRQLRAEEAERNRIERGEQLAADRLAREDLRRMPAVVVHTGGGGSRSAGGAGPLSDGKPLTAAQEKAALELGSNRSNLEMLANTFKDEYSGDIRSTLQRKFGETAGGLAPEKTQEMTRWWANQAMFDDLPQRHELFGATLTAGEKAAWAQAAINPSMSPKAIRDRMDIRRKIYNDAEARMRGSVEAGGKSTKQFDAAVGKSAPKAPTPAGVWDADKESRYQEWKARQGK